MKSYLDALSSVLWYGTIRSDRTDVGKSVCFSGIPMRFDMRKGFPLVTTKKLWWQGAFHELLWLLKGTDDVSYLLENNVHYWENWTDTDPATGKSSVGRTYGVQWRDWRKYSSSFIPDSSGSSIDQLQNCVDSLRKGPPYSRRLVVSAWNPADLLDMLPNQLPPCHILFQFVAIEQPPDASGKQETMLDLVMYQRSCDMFLGVPFDIVLYGLLLEIVAHCVGMTAGTLSIMLGDAHIYTNHLVQVTAQLSRVPYSLPRLEINDELVKGECEVDNFTFNDFSIYDYEHHPTLKGKVAL